MKINNISVYNFRNAIRGMRNPLKSWDKIDSKLSYGNSNSDDWCFEFGKNDWELALKLVKAGSDHRKFLRQIFVSMDIEAPWYWWKEYSTYKIATVENSTSTMHLITKRELTKDDFEWDKMTDYRENQIKHLNKLIKTYQKLNKKIDASNGWSDYKRLCKKQENIWRELIQDVPGSFIYKKTCSLNYEVLRNMYHSRKLHKLKEWHDFCNTVENLPYSTLITIKKGNN